MAESIMLEKAKDFAVNIVNLCRNIKETKRECVLTNQLLRSGTSIGANIHESKYAHGTADFIPKTGKNIFFLAHRQKIRTAFAVRIFLMQ